MIKDTEVLRRTRMIKDTEVLRRTYYDEFDNTVNGGIEWDVVALIVVMTTTHTYSTVKTIYY